MFTFDLTCAPKNVETVIAELRLILKRLRTEPVSEEFITKLKTIEKQNWQDESKTNWYWKYELLWSLLFGQDIGELSEWGNYIEAITPESLRASRIQCSRPARFAELNPVQGFW